LPKPLPAFVLLLALVLGLPNGSAVSARSAGDQTRAPGGSQDAAMAAHLLNRLGYGPVPGQIEQLQRLGLARYIEQQLNPEKLPDAALSARLARFGTLTLGSRDIAGRYYVPFLTARRELTRQRTAAAPVTPAPSPQAESGSGRKAPGDPKSSGNTPLEGLSPADRVRLQELRREQQTVLDELGQQKLLRAVYSERQLQEVLVDFWFNHFNVFAGKGPVRVYLTEYEREAIRPHILGSFRELLGAVAHSPAMLFYLDNWQSSDPDFDPFDERARLRQGHGAVSPELEERRRSRMRPRRGVARLPDSGRDPFARARTGRLASMSEEERRAVLEQVRKRMPRGLNENYARELLELHTLGVDGGYTQQDIVEVAKAFTGWTIRDPRAGGGFWFDDRRHVKGPKRLLGHTMNAGGERDGEAVLDLLARHPSTARFIATKLARRFVADDPPASLVARAAETFRKTNGNLREVTRTIVTSPELLSPEAMRAKAKTPFEFVASALRATGADIQQGRAILRSLAELGMPLYFSQPPTGYADRADAWVNTGALLNRMNFALALVANRIPGTSVDVAALAGAGGIEAARAQLRERLLGGEVSSSTDDTIARAEEPAKAAALALGSPEFQRR
jgi:uncharacterized protein (DUF1800 family)